MPNPSAAMIVIGDEILSGRTREANAHYLAGRFCAHGIDLREVRVIGDSSEAIIGAVRDLSLHHDHVVTSGGIGPTHDDITADAVAEALGAPIGVRADAKALLEAHYAARGQELNEARLRMARIPDRAHLIDNPISAAPGFSLDNVHVLAGVPMIFEAMVESLLPRLSGGTPLHSRTIPLMRGEGDVAAALSEIDKSFQGVSIGSYPALRAGVHSTDIVLRGADEVELERAAARVRALE